MQLPYRKAGKYTNVPNDPLMTQDKFDAFKKKLERLKRSQTPAAREVARLAELGDFSENVEYQLAKGKLRSINNSILKIDRILMDAVIIQSSDASKVRVGSTVTVSIEGKEKTYTILGSSETDPTKGIISHSSPLGSKLLGMRIDEEIEIEIGGNEKNFKVIRIQ